MISSAVHPSVTSGRYVRVGGRCVGCATIRPRGEERDHGGVRRRGRSPPGAPGGGPRHRRGLGDPRTPSQVLGEDAALDQAGAVLPISRWHYRGVEDRVVGPDTELVIDGFQRSANTFASIAFEISQPGDARPPTTCMRLADRRGRSHAHPLHPARSRPCRRGDLAPFNACRRSPRGRR